MLTNGSGNGSLSVCPGGRNKKPQAGWLLNNRNALHTFLEAGGLRSVPARLGEGRAGLRLLISSCDVWARGCSEVSLTRALTPFLRALPS